MSANLIIAYTKDNQQAPHKTHERKKRETADFKPNEWERLPPFAPRFCLFWLCVRHSLPPAAVRVCRAPLLRRRRSLRFGRCVRRRRAPARQSALKRLVSPLCRFCAVPGAPPGLSPCPPRSRGLSAVSLIIGGFSATQGAPRPSQVPGRGVPCVVKSCEVPQKAVYVLIAKLVCGTAVNVRTP